VQHFVCLSIQKIDLRMKENKFLKIRQIVDVTKSLFTNVVNCSDFTNLLDSCFSDLCHCLFFSKIYFCVFFGTLEFGLVFF
jgi:hypothetical protein